MAPLDRAETIRRIRTALKARSGKTWSVRGGSGTSWGWISIQSPPKRRVRDYYMSQADCAGLALHACLSFYGT